ncbi:MAG: phosphatidylserine/phosphatidylglycerophosphate/cardiolipin synthase family protein [Desulfobacterales bacterium]|jgi:putative cardiolipin synthase
MRENILRFLLTIALILILSCASTRSSGNKAGEGGAPPSSKVPASAIQGSPFGPNQEFIGSPYKEIGVSGLFDTHSAEGCRIAVLPNGDDSFAARIQTLEKADTSIRIQALVFTGDESGLYIAELLKAKKALGLDVRVIVDAMSNPGPQTQWMYFDLKQNGIEVEGYETFYLQWLNELPVTSHDAADKTTDPNKRYHEKMWIIDGETNHGVAVVGGLNIANEYFRIDPQNPSRYWRDQDVIVKGDVIKDMVASFDRNFEYFLKVKESRGILNTNIYWGATRYVFEKTGKMDMRHVTDERLKKNVRELADKKLELKYEAAKCRFFQNRPRFGETYIEQAYLKSIKAAKKEILIGNAYFVASATFVETVKDAVRRCVKVIILTNSPETNDLPMLTIVGRDFYDDILAVNDETVVQSCDGGGVQIWEWQGRRTNATEQTEGTMHAKYAVFDRRVSIVGSYNMDPRSRTLNSESAIVFENRNLSRQLADMYYENDLDFSKQITLEDTVAFTDSADAVYQLEKDFGIFIEDDL